MCQEQEFLCKTCGVLTYTDSANTNLTYCMDCANDRIEVLEAEIKAQAQAQKELKAQLEALIRHNDSEARYNNELEQYIEKLEHPLRQARVNAEQHLTTVKASAEYVRMRKRIEELEAWNKELFDMDIEIITELEQRIKELERVREHDLEQEQVLLRRIEALEAEIKALTQDALCFDYMKLQKRNEDLEAALRMAGQLALDNRWTERFPKVFNTMETAFGGDDE